MKSVTIEQQIELEQYYTTLAQETFKKKLEQARNQGRITSQPLGSGLKNLFVEALATNIGSWVDEQTKPKRGVSKKYVPLLRAMLEAFGRENLILNICATVLERAINETLATDHKANVSSVAFQIGKSLYYNGYTEAYLKQDGTGTQVNRIQEGLNKRAYQGQKERHIANIMKKNKFEWVKFEKAVIMLLGVDLLYILVKSTDLIKVTECKNSIHYLEPTQALLDTYRYNAEFISKFIVDRTPTIIKPKPWDDLSHGGYYGAMANRLHFMRINHLVGKTKVVKGYLKKIRDVDLSKIYGAVNKIQETSYRINKEMYEVINNIIEQGGGATEPQAHFTVVSTATDWNTFTNTGVYQIKVAGGANAPAQTPWSVTIPDGFLKVVNYGNGQFIEQYFYTNNGEVYYRFYGTPRWRSWGRVQTSLNGTVRLYGGKELRPQ